VILQENLRLRNSSKLKEQAQVFHLTENQESLFDPKAHLSNPKARRILVLFLNNVSSMIFHSYIRNCTSSLIFFVYWDLRRLPAGKQACLPVGREDRNAQISIWHQLHSCFFCLLAK